MKNKIYKSMKESTLVKGAFCILVPTLLATSSCTSKEEISKQPNIIFILADDLGYGDITPYGQKLIETPNLMKLSHEGMMFTQCYAGNTVSAPSRCVLLTGLHTGHSQVRGNKEIQPEGQAPMLADIKTFPEMLKTQGYVTGGFGKWGLGFPGSTSTPGKMGFDEFYGYNCQRMAHEYYPDHLWHNDTRVEFPENQNKNQVVYSADIIQEHALQFIRDNKDKRFFAYVACTLPHAALTPPHDSIYNHYLEKFSDNPGKAFINGDYDDSEYPHASFAAMVTRLDLYVGQIMNLLDSLNLSDNTILCFTSDNGPHLEGGADPVFFDGNGPLRGYKRDMYEGGIRVPMIVRYPNYIKADTKSDFPIAFWDMYQTFGDLAGNTEKIMSDGISILPTLFGKEGQENHKYLYWEFPQVGGRQALRVGDWKLVRNNLQNPSKTTTELYNIKEDLGEKDNLASQYPQKCEEMISMIKNVRVDNPNFPLYKNESK